MASNVDRPGVLARVAGICEGLRGRAAGCWSLDREAGRLVLAAFAAGDGLDPEVGRAFAEATRAVPLDRTDLGIVAAVAGRGPAISRAAELPPEAGSGYWLRSFGADLSMAVPILGSESGDVLGILSVALRPETDEAEALALGRLIEECRGMAVLLAPG